MNMFVLMLGMLISNAATPEVAAPVRVIDGDTIKVPAALVTGLPSLVSVRILGVNAPELHGKCDKEKAHAQAAKLYLQDRFATAKQVKIEFVRADKYARIDGRITLDGKDLAADLIAGGYAVPYNGGYRDPMFWCKVTP